MRVNIAAPPGAPDIGENGQVDSDSRASRTALATARFRAMHQLLEHGSVLADPLAVRIVGESEDDLRALDLDRKLRSSGASAPATPRRCWLQPCRTGSTSSCRGSPALMTKGWWPDGSPAPSGQPRV
jgi:hypothetical protein